MHGTKQYDVILDAREERCPMPLLKMKLALSKMDEDQLLCVLATDEGSRKDIPHYLSMVGVELKESGTKPDGSFYFIVAKGGQ
ncbi:sulfurtransferase TusA family protein [Marinomonas piezotolerans]|uniref:Sulfurtransferase TusA family protein n=1 Tax=Marinomonas piezotolerans TaxID=2213058 RepID=A0A370UDQ6_9GAMM|nr:sulfurtransferase TusA family protein [Marinomonas piezotolerans]RDL45881.1 sulfurtransferase TusA family protein [Marinomonas piezotolerans]